MQREREKGWLGDAGSEVLNQLNQAFYIPYIKNVRYPSYIYDGANIIKKKMWHVLSKKNTTFIYNNKRLKIERERERVKKKTGI